MSTHHDTPTSLGQPELRVVATEDGSPTLYNATLGEHYHSVHGAVQESRHIFVEMGLRHRLGQARGEWLRVLEVGFGSGLNALLTLEVSQREGIRIDYTSLELYPLDQAVYSKLRFPLDWHEADSYVQALHQAPWGKAQMLEGAEGFRLDKRQCRAEQFEGEGGYDLIYFDAFSPETQPELWSEELFRRLYAQAREGAVLTTYCAKGEVRRRLGRAGWLVERLPGPPGKREILRATK